MKKFKKRSLIVLTVFCMIFWLGCEAKSARTVTNSTDISGHWAYTPIKSLINKGVLSGYEDGTFHPDKSISRAEFITVVNRAFAFNTTTDITYSDVRSGTWYYNEIARAKAAGYISGYPDGTMRPNALLSRQEAAAMLAKILKLDTAGNGSLPFGDSGRIPSWSRNAVAAMVTAGRIGGYPDGSFQPYNAISRAETAVMISGIQTTPSTPVSYNIKDYGARGDGVTDDSQAIQNAANKARDNNGTLIIPAGNYLINDRVRIYSSVACKGKIIMQNGKNNASIVVSRWGNFAKIQPAALTGFTRGSTHLTGLNDYAGGTVILESTEKLIDRVQWGTDYTKNDTSEITSNDGSISPALDCTYNDLSKLSITVYQYEKPIVISGLNVESEGNALGKGHLVYCVRSNVRFDNPVIVNTSQVGTAGCGLHIYDCVNVKVNNPIISNFQPRGGDGYGIALGNTANIAILNGKITDCSNHAITGRQDKNVLIKGGTYAGNISPLDNHWGNKFVIENATLLGDSGVTYAGTDITIRNCKFVDCINILSIRTDTPNIMGSVIMEDVTANNKKGYKTIYCYRASSRGTAIPNRVYIANVMADIPSDGYLYYSEINTDNASVYAGRMIFKNIQTVGNVGKIITR